MVVRKLLLLVFSGYGRRDDGMSDSWEVDGGLNPTQKDGGTDFDNDGLSAKREFKWRTDPRNADTDGDNVSDGDEVAAGTNPRRADTN